jgi:hypothetical protein
MPQPDLSQLLERGAAQPRTPGDVDDVWRRGQSRGRRKRVAIATGSALAIIAVFSLAATLWQPPPAPFIQPAPDEGGRWGPLAVVAGPPSGDLALIAGTLEITDRCVRLGEQGNDVLLVWPADATVWNPEQRTIRYTNRDGATVELRDGTQVSFGGGGDSSTEGGEPPQAWANRVDWVSPPASDCLTDARWWVNDVVETPRHLTLPNVEGLPLAQAQEQLEFLGLQGEPVSGPGWSDPTDPEAVVVRQKPPAGTLVPRDAVVGFRTALITPTLCDVFTEVPRREGDGTDLAGAAGFWTMLERAQPVAPQPLANDIRALRESHEAGQPIEEAPARALDRVTIHHDACHAQQ